LPGFQKKIANLLFRYNWFARTNQNLEEQTFKLTELVTVHPPNHQDKCKKVVRFHLEPSLINYDYEDGINVIHGAEEGTKFRGDAV
jgi:hypothetical protein